MQAFVNTARKIYEKIEQGVLDVSNEVRSSRHFCTENIVPSTRCPLAETGRTEPRRNIHLRAAIV